MVSKKVQIFKFKGYTLHKKFNYNRGLLMDVIKPQLIYRHKGGFLNIWQISRVFLMNPRKPLTYFLTLPLHFTTPLSLFFVN